jgi:branched-chain amino acid transport system permease protein
MALILLGIACAIILPRINAYFVYVASLALIRAIGAIGLVVLSGVAGQLSLCTAALLAVGAYTTGMLMTHLGVGFLPAAICGALATCVIGTALAAPALRLTGLHLPIVTLAFGVIAVQLIGRGGKFTGGMGGLFLPPATLLGWPLDTDLRRLVVIIGPFLLATAASINFLRLKPGRALFALRDRELTAQALGVNTSGYKILAFAYASLLAGVAGALYAGFKGYVSVDDFTLWDSIYFFVMIAIGGMTSVAGAIIGAIFVTAVPELLSGVAEASQLIFGALLLLIVAFLPGGLVSIWRRWLRPRLALASPALDSMAPE